LHEIPLLSMRKFLFIAVTPLLLVGCQKSVYQADREALLQNPLYLEMYAEQFVDTMVNLSIYQDPITQDEAKMKIVDKTKEYWLQKSAEARKMQREGSKGAFIPMSEYTEGETLFINNMIHMSPGFFVNPGPNLHVFLTQAVDPRDVEFPDVTAIDAGEILVPYGAQSFAIDEEIEEPRLYRTVVLWDTDLERLYGFAQINPLY